MKQRLIIVMCLVLVAAGLAAVFFSQKQSPKPLPTPVHTVDRKDMPPSASSAEEPGRYEEYSQAALESAKGTRLLFFHAPWCPQCRKLDADIKAQGVPQGVVILKVDYDSNQALRQKYGVTLQTTVVRIDGEDKLVKKYVAYDQPTLEAVKQQLLAQ